MSREAFTNTKFSPENAEMIKRVNRVIRLYQKMGYRLSLRQLYYQLVSRNIVVNTPRSYDHVGDLVSRARMAGLIDWDMIEDRTRSYIIPQHFRKPEDVLATAAATYKLNKWAGQKWHVEVMVEKEALSGVLMPVCSTWDVGFSANRGYSSSSTMYAAGKRIQAKAQARKKILVLYLGDLDPSGWDMTRDVADRLSTFSGAGLTVKRLALNPQQVAQYAPPPNPTKMTDKRARKFVAKFGDESYELDALDPSVLAELVVREVRAVLDEDKWEARKAKERAEREQLTQLVRQWGTVSKVLEKHGRK